MKAARVHRGARERSGVAGNGETGMASLALVFVDLARAQDLMQHLDLSSPDMTWLR